MRLAGKRNPTQELEAQKGLKRDLVRVIGNMCYDDRVCQVPQPLRLFSEPRHQNPTVLVRTCLMSLNLGYSGACDDFLVLMLL